ncbi:beta-lactamase family protein [Caballeronia sp. SEWSISQ10-4 2]|uniref:serine hydrolase domain-containing protein n=1 Tax=Caballeronia sp. SEWSISQ10-4 2 TaxID=2937438 RepID=UPI002655A63A|nr:serine hydrolase domain-containing protein [Caballeronia sp. SEWSISQ10-4 2]MDN7176986.1 beta-lactamase family protein [Caballeronia sp. SEWSISQ10-4 2]
MHDSDWIDLDRLVEDAMKCWGIPGLAIAVVQDDEVILLKGYGVRELGVNAPVTCDTQFMICSLTKSVTAAGLALLVDEQRLDWETRVREILPEFQLCDAAATEAITISDLLTHRSGLPRHDRIWSPPGERSREQILEAMRYLEPSRKLREAYQYSNLGYVVAGMVAERLSRQAWEEFTAQRLLLPLGFSNFGFSTAALESSIDHAHPYGLDGRDVYREELWPMHAAPAGGITASVEDMARWLQFLLSRGRANDKQLVSVAAVDAMMTPRVDVGDSEFAEIGRSQYGYGLESAHYRGDRSVFHTGSLPGWATLVSMLPDHGIGVVVLTNRDPCSVRELIAYAVFDRLRSLPPINWLEIFQIKRKKQLEEKAYTQGFEVPGVSALLFGEPPRDFVGEYEHPAYGCISIVQTASEARWSWRGLSGVLIYRGGDSFQLKEDGIPRYASGIPILFERNAGGLVDRLKSPLEPAVSDIVFQRQIAG